MKKLTFKSLLLLCALIVGSNAWADVEIAAGTFEKTTVTTGWTSSGTGTSTTGCIVVGKDENITSPTLNLSLYSKVTISITARRYGSLSGSKATIDASISGSSLGTSNATSTTVSDINDIEFEPTASMTSVAIVFTCTNATSAGSTHGAGIGSITITGTLISDDPSSDVAFTSTTPTFNLVDGDVYSQIPTTADGYSGTITYEILTNTAGATINTTSGVVSPTKAGSVKVKATAAAVIGSFAESTATYTLTVTDTRSKTNISSTTLNTTFFSTTEHTSGTAASALSFSGTTGGVTITYKVPKSSNYYINSTQIRPYNTCTLQFDAPQGFHLVSITFTSDGSKWEDATPTNGVMDGSNTKIWNGNSSSVSFTWSTSGTRIKSITAVLTPVMYRITPTPSDLYATFWANHNVAIPSGVKAYTARYSAIDETTGKLSLDELSGTVIPANVAVILKANSESDLTNGKIYLGGTATSASFAGQNILKGSNGTATGGSTIYVLGKQGEPAITGFYKLASGTIPANKAYLDLNDLSGQNAPQSIRFEFEEENATNIEDIKTSEKAVKFFENGQLLILRDGIVYDALGRIVR